MKANLCHLLIKFDSLSIAFHEFYLWKNMVDFSMDFCISEELYYYESRLSFTHFLLTNVVKIFYSLSKNYLIKQINNLI